MGSSGRQLAAIAGVSTPAGQNLVGWAFDPAYIRSGKALGVAGTAYVIQVRAVASVITNIEVEVTGAGTGLSNSFALVTNDAGAQIGSGAITADQSTAWQSTGRKVMALTAPQAATPGAFYRVVLWANGTLPSFACAADVVAGTLNAGLSAPNFRFSTANTGLTTVAVPGSFNLTAQTALGTAYWAAFS